MEPISLRDLIFLGVGKGGGSSQGIKLREVSITPGDYTVKEFFDACQAAVGDGINRWVVINTYPLTSLDIGGISTYIFANGSAYDGATSVFINNGAQIYGGIQKSTGRNNTSETKATITADMKFYSYVWGNE